MRTNSEQPKEVSAKTETVLQASGSEEVSVITIEDTHAIANDAGGDVVFIDWYNGTFDIKEIAVSHDFSRCSRKKAINSFCQDDLGHDKTQTKPMSTTHINHALLTLPPALVKNPKIRKLEMANPRGAGVSYGVGRYHVCFSKNEKNPDQMAVEVRKHGVVFFGTKIGY